MDATAPIARAVPSHGLLDPIDRVSEIIFGLIMVLTFTGALSAGDPDRLEVRSMIVSALGCNLAWGLVDAVMYLMSILTARAHGRVRIADDEARPELHRNDLVAAVAVFLLVFLSTFPVVLPFMLMEHVKTALRVSNAVAIVMLFLCGYSLGRHASWRPVRTGIAMAAIGTVLVAITIALGG